MCYIKQNGPGSKLSGNAHTRVRPWHYSPHRPFSFFVVQCTSFDITTEYGSHRDVASTGYSYHILKQPTQGVVTIDVCLNSSRLVIFSWELGAKFQRPSTVDPFMPDMLQLSCTSSVGHPSGKCDSL